ncbi:MAG: glycerophosphodiester phosphodiesterase family protein [Bacteroides sp.]|nr:glycerophosphodiester phosphodiesterase family protein [Bacteroides sp.]
MKKTLLILFAFICALTACTEQKPTPTRAERIREQLLTCDESSVIVVAHRADWRNFPENSLEAIQSAIEMGVDMLEIDVQRTKDGVLILMHDHNLDRTTTRSGNIADTNWEDIAKLNLKDHQGNVTTYKVPKLEDALLMCKDRIMINLDKADRYFDEVFAMLERTGTTNLIVMKGGQPANEVKEKFGKYLEKVIYMPVVNIDKPESEQAIYDFLNDLKPLAFELCWNNPESEVPAKMEKALKGRSLIWYNTLWDWLCAGHNDDKAVDNPDGTWGYMIDTLGARILQTDRPQLMIEYLRSRKLHE